MRFRSFRTGHFLHRQPTNVSLAVIGAGLKLAFVFASEVRLPCQLVKGLRKLGAESDEAWIDVVLGQSGNLIGSQS